jgi:hypothetical protein
MSLTVLGAVWFGVVIALLLASVVIMITGKTPWELLRKEPRMRLEFNLSVPGHIHIYGTYKELKISTDDAHVLEIPALLRTMADAVDQELTKFPLKRKESGVA